jgi:catechol 2,3-dioxygenase-like lactoylglutathione lyase family enzyme
VDVCREENRSTLLVATAAADTRVLRFYQLLGFRLLRVERDVFTSAAGYPQVEVDGVALRDRVWLSLTLRGPGGDAGADTVGAVHLRVARHTDRLEEVVAFYRDGLGLTQSGAFHDHDGYDGVFLEVPESGAQLEFTTGGAHSAPAPHPESLLVLYLGDTDAVRRRVSHLSCVEPVVPANPYWLKHGVTFKDPDGFQVVLVAERWES